MSDEVERAMANVVFQELINHALRGYANGTEMPYKLVVGLPADLGINGFDVEKLVAYVHTRIHTFGDGAAALNKLLKLEALLEKAGQLEGPNQYFDPQAPMLSISVKICRPEEVL